MTKKNLQQGEEVFIYDMAYETRMADYYRLDMINITNRPNEWEPRYDDVNNSINMVCQQRILLTFFTESTFNIFPV